MKDNEVKKLAQLRRHVVEYYEKLEEPTSPTSLMNTRDTAYLCEQIIASLDDVIKTYVTFE
jgi:hypothetical protein